MKPLSARYVYSFRVFVVDWNVLASVKVVGCFNAVSYVGC